MHYWSAYNEGLFTFDTVHLMNIRNQYRQINVQHNSGWYKEINLALKIIQALLAESGRHIL